MNMDIAKYFILDEYYKNKDIDFEKLKKDFEKELEVSESYKETTNIKIDFDFFRIYEEKKLSNVNHLQKTFKDKETIRLFPKRDGMIIVTSQSQFPLSKNVLKEKYSELPTEEEFKKRAWELKNEKGIKLTAALNELSNLYGYSCFNAIKPKLINSK